MKSLEFSLCGHEIAALVPDKPGNCPLVVAHERAEEIFLLSLPETTAVIAVTDADFSRDMSPWPAGRAFKGGMDFTGGADEYLKILVNEIIPAAEKFLGLAPRYRVIAGCSMAGLFAVYAFFRTDVFARGVSVSGSLWYDKFSDFMAENSLRRVPEKFYFSLGDREAKTRNQRLAAVEDKTRAARELFAAAGAETVFQLNPGGHFDDVAERLSRGIGWIL
jgi:hypothetical protein